MNSPPIRERSTADPIVFAPATPTSATSTWGNNGTLTLDWTNNSTLATVEHRRQPGAALDQQFDAGHRD
jgi:hypothetical protein